MTNSTDFIRLACVIATACALAACGSPAPRKGGGSGAPSVLTAPAAPVKTEAASELGKGDPDARFQEALALMKARRYSEAQTAFLALSRDYPKFSGPLTDLGILYAQSRQRALAISSLARAVSLNPRNEVAHNWLGTLYRETGDNLRAEQSYRSAIQLRPSYAQAHLNLAILYDVVLHRPREALASYRDYQRVRGSDDLIVSAWIRDLESRLETPAPAARTTVAEVRP